MTVRRIVAAVALAAAISGRTARAELLPLVSLGDLVRWSDVIAVVRITAYTQDRHVATAQDRAAAASQALMYGGQYALNTLGTLKGRTSPRLRIHIDTLKAFITDYTRPPLTAGAHALLFLRRGANGAVAPTVAGLAMIPISARAAHSRTAGNPHGEAIGVLLESARQRRYRRSSLYMLSREVDSRIRNAATAYAADPDIHVRDLALYARATNQDLSAIPAILAMEEKVQKQYDSCAECISGLSAYTDPRAIRALAPLVISPSQWVRANVSDPVRKLANRSSIPYLLLALHDPEICNAGAAYQALHRVIGSLGPAKGLDYFEAHRDEECAALFEWWRDELAGEHPVANGPRAPAGPVPPASNHTAPP